MNEAILRAALNGILFIAASGNSAQNNDLDSSFPSSYTTKLTTGYEAVISVSSIDKYGSFSYFSNYGASTVDLGAPGSSIYSTIPGGSYATYSGTSMAAPHVTGAVALYSSTNPSANGPDIVQALLESTVPTASLNGKTATGGRLDVGAMLIKTFRGGGDTTAPTVGSFSPLDGATVLPLTATSLSHSARPSRVEQAPYTYAPDRPRVPLPRPLTLRAAPA